jgi:hypothetical protein
MKEEKREEKKVEEEKTGAGSKASVGDLIKVGARVQLGFRLTGRELDLLEFVLDQKFAGIDAMYQRFYAVENSKSQRYAAERVQLLRRHGFLRAENVYTEPKLFYLTTHP